MYAHCKIDNWLEILPCHWSDYNLARELVDISPETRRKELQELVRFLRFCEQLHPDGPMRSHLFEGEAPPVPLPIPHALSLEEERALLVASAFIYDGAAGDGWRLTTSTGKAAWIQNWPPGAFQCLVLLGLRLGLRPGELQFLAWSEIYDLDGGSPHVRLGDQRDDTGRLRVRILKNRLASTPLSLPAECVKALRDLRDWQNQQPEGSALARRRFVFAVADSSLKRGWRAPNYDHIWSGLRVRMGLPWLNCYALRHTFATRLIERDPPLDPHYRRRLMRHVNDQTAETYYIQRWREGQPLDLTTGRPLTETASSSRQKIGVQVTQFEVVESESAHNGCVLNEGEHGKSDG
jgi:integrase